MSTNKDEEFDKTKFLTKDIIHRLTLLRSFRERVNNGYDFTNKGDIYRCLKDSNLISARLFIEFLGLKGFKENNNYKLTDYKSTKKDDVQIDKFINRLIQPDEIPPTYHRILSGVYLRANKEIAHLTKKYNEEFNEPEILISAATIIEELLKKYLYDFIEIPLPDIDK